MTLVTAVQGGEARGQSPMSLMSVRRQAMLPHPITPSLYPWTHRSLPSPLTHPTKIPLELRMRPTSTRRQMITSSKSKPRYPSHL